MKVQDLQDSANYCVAVSERGYGCWTYQTYTGAQLKANWQSLEGFYTVLAAPSDTQKWTPLELPNGVFMLVRQHQGVVTPDVLMSVQLSRIASIPHGCCKADCSSGG
jgi:hypothetical protein